MAALHRANGSDSNIEMSSRSGRNGHRDSSRKASPHHSDPVQRAAGVLRSACSMPEEK